MTLSQTQLRFISSLGIGILVGTSLIVIIPEGIEAVAKTGLGAHEHGTRHVIRRHLESSAFPTPDVSMTTRQDNKDLLGCIESGGIPGNLSLHRRDNACDIVVRSLLINTASDNDDIHARGVGGCIEPLDASHKPSSCDPNAARGKDGLEARNCIEPSTDEIAARNDKPASCDPQSKRDFEIRQCIQSMGDALDGVQVHAISPVCDQLIRDTVIPAREAMLKARGCIEAVNYAEGDVEVHYYPPACDRKIRLAFITGSETDILEARGCVERRTVLTGLEARKLPPACDKKIRTALASRRETDLLQARGCVERRNLPPVCDKMIRTALATGQDKDVLEARRCIEPAPTLNLPPACDPMLRIKAKRDSSSNPRAEPEKPKDEPSHSHNEGELPTFFIGFSLVIGFVLMFLIDRLPAHATENLQSAPATRHISLDNLESSSVRGDDESQGFLGSLTPSSRQTRGFATTVGLIIHATADGIAMGASAVTDDMKLGFIIFLAIMIHKAPAAFGLTSVLLKQGLSKRAARVHLVAFSLAAPVGALTTYLAVSAVGGSGMQGEAGQWWTGMLLLFSGGTFL